MKCKKRRAIHLPGSDNACNGAGRLFAETFLEFPAAGDQKNKALPLKVEKSLAA
jgi:hypothetical protein